MADVQQEAGIARAPGMIASITGDPDARLVWLIVVGALVFLVVVGASFRPR